MIFLGLSLIDKLGIMGLIIRKNNYDITMLYNDLILQNICFILKLINYKFLIVSDCSGFQ